MTWRYVVVAAILAVVAAPLQAHVGPHPEKGIEFEQRLGAAMPTDLAFVNARGARERLGDALRARPSVLLFGYLGCRDLCATTLPGVAEALDAAGLQPNRDYRAVFADIDAREGPEVLAEGAARLPAADRGAWTFLGADAKNVARLADAAGFRYRYEPERDAFAHPAGFVVLTPEGRASRYFMGVRFEPAQVRQAIEQAAASRTGGLAARLVLLCYHFDPATGRYSLAILDGLRALIAGCAIALAVFLGWRRARRVAA